MKNSINFKAPIPTKVLSFATAALVAVSIATTNISAQTTSIPMSKTQEVMSMFTTADLLDANIPELSKAMQEGKVTSEKLVQMYLDRIAAYDKTCGMNSIIATNKNALSIAKKLDKERKEGQIRGPLHGVPIIVKDNYDYKGMPTTAGSTALSGSIANDDAFVISQLEKQGAIILAKANLSEFAFSGSNSRSAIGGTTYNAYDNTKTPAGSSGGTAVSITSNFAAAGLGTDTGSSIRRPSSFGNLYGLRPSKGLTSIDGVVPLSADQDVTGPICRSVEDLAIMLDAIAGTDAKDRYTSDADANSLIPDDGYVSYLKKDGLQGKKIGYLTNSFGINAKTTKDDSGNWVTTNLDEPIPMDEKIAPMTDKAIQTLKDGGAELVDISDLIPDSLIFSLNGAVSSAKLEGSSAFEWDMHEYFNALGDNATMHGVADIVANGGYISNLSRYTVANEDLVNPRFNDDGTIRESYKANWDARLNFRNTITNILKDNGIDAVVYVSQIDVPCDEADSPDSSKIHSNSAAYINKFGPVAGLPDMMIPMGFSGTKDEDNVTVPMPVGISMFSGYGKEATLIQMAYAYEQLADNIRKAPSNSPSLPDTDLNNYLDTLISDSESLKASDYTNDTYNELTSAITAAKSVDKTDVSSTYDATLSLAKAYDGLKAVSASTIPTTPTTSTDKKIPNPATGNNNSTILISISLLSIATLLVINKKKINSYKK